MGKYILSVKMNQNISKCQYYSVLYKPLFKENSSVRIIILLSIIK